MLSQADIFPDLRRLPGELPVQILLGDADQITPVAQNMRVAEAVPGARVHTLHGVGHAAYVEDPDALVSRLRDFFTSTQRKTS